MKGVPPRKHRITAAACVWALLAVWLPLNAATGLSSAADTGPATGGPGGAAPEASAEKSLEIDLGNGVVMEFAWIEAGSFRMGSPESELLDQKPGHEVTIDEPFYIGRFEVTQEQWTAVMDEADNPSIHKPPYIPESGNYPVDNVSWVYCRIFLERLNEKVPGHEFRLPTEAEWEYACRAGTAGERHFDDDEAELDDYAWYSGNSDNRSRPVGGREPNPWGLYDMYGNVWEWCADRYEAYPGGNLPNGVSPGGYVLRGGGYDSLSERLTSAYRIQAFRRDADRNRGLRVVAAEPASE